MTEEQDKGRLWPQLRGFCGGVASGVSKLVVGHPFDTIKVRMQNEGYHGRFDGPLNCLWQTIKKEGIKKIKNNIQVLLRFTRVQHLHWYYLLYLQ